MKTCRTNFPAHLGLFLVVLTLGGAVRAADVVDNWSFLEPGVLPKVTNFAPLGFPIYISGLKAGGLVDAESTPANPFEEGTRALHVESSAGNGVLRIFTRPFPDETPAQGFYEFTFRLVEGAFSFNPEFFSGPSDPNGIWFRSAATEQLFGFAFNPGRPIYYSKQPLVTDEIKGLGADENYTFRIEWKTSGENLEFHFLLNGKSLAAANGEVVSKSVPQSQIAGTVLGFRLASGSADSQCFTGFLGSIRAEALNP